MPARFLDQVVGALGPGSVRAGPEECVDYSGRFRGTTPAVLLPRSTLDVAEVVRLARAAGIALVPQGGNTGLVGGGVPLAGEVLLSLRGLGMVSDVDAAAGQLTAGAGVTLAEVHRRAAETGWAYGVDFASRAQCTIGGNIATNAGGLHVLRHGDTRTQVIGVEAVLGDGSVVSHLGGLLKDNTGYHLPSLLCGSEGTLGIVTAARLRLVAPFEHRAVAMVGFDSVDEAVVAAAWLRRMVRTLDAVELMLARGVALVCETFGWPLPIVAGDPAAYLLVEVADAVPPAAELAAAVASLEGLTGAVAAVEPEARANLWRYREQHTAAVNTLGAPHKLDLTLPVGALAAFMRDVPPIVESNAPGARAWMWGHAADGNVHVNVTGVGPDDERVDDALFRFAADMGGSISAEHGIGAAKKRWLHLNRSESEIAAFRSIKRALDPAGILNPNAVLP